MFILKKCSYEELQAIQHREDLLLSGWTLLEKEYMDVTEKVYDEDGTMVALINYYFLNENKDRMMIVLFEVFKPYRGRGLGKRIIAQFLQDYYGEVNLESSGEEGDVKAEQESEKKIDEFNIPTVTKTYKREEPVTIKFERILNATQDLLWEEEFDASKEEVLSYSHPCAELINTLELRQNKYDGYYYDVNNELIAFDTDLTNQKAGLII